eukprot:m.359489 g.359489  ORF g.359489 m.359489 type:complete len:532 (+) comp18590_c0_seq1:196-1791(+)
MATSEVIAEQRLLHEEVERTIEATTLLKMEPFSTQHNRVQSQNIVKILAERVSEKSSQLLAMYADESGARAREERLISSDPFPEFYKRLEDIRQYHKQNPHQIAEPMSIDLIPSFITAPESDVSNSKKEKQQPPDAKKRDRGLVPEVVSFSGEEGSGRFLDLTGLYEEFLNLKGVERVSYLTYIQTYDSLYMLDSKLRLSGAYRHYIEHLAHYLTGFFSRAFPLRNLDAELEKAAAKFEKDWAASRFRGWVGHKFATADEAIDLTTYTSPADLEALGAARIKSALQAIGLKCGGTLSQRCQRLFSTKGVPCTEWPKSILAKGGKRSADTATKGTVAVDPAKSVAKVEAVVYAVARLLNSTQHRTKENVERKMARSATEMEQDDDDDYLLDLAEEEFEDDEDEEVGLKAARSNMVVDWDGKPIAYWLYRLHGLNQVFTCEICGNTPYRGPKVFQQHFREWRHAHGMRCLGIPNTKHFHNITNINDAKALWSRLQQQKKDEQFRAEHEEEFEDSMGNVFNKKTYEDLKRQGLL